MIFIIFLKMSALVGTPPWDLEVEVLAEVYRRAAEHRAENGSVARIPAPHAAMSVVADGREGFYHPSACDERNKGQKVSKWYVLFHLRVWTMIYSQF